MEAGDVARNAAFEDARFEQARLEARIAELEQLLATAQVIDLDQGLTDEISLGSVAHLAASWNWPRKMYSPKLEISSSLIRAFAQKQADYYTVTSNANGWGYRNIPGTRRWLSGPAVSSGSAPDQYIPWLE